MKITDPIELFQHRLKLKKYRFIVDSVENLLSLGRSVVLGNISEGEGFNTFTTKLKELITKGEEIILEESVGGIKA